MDTKTMSITAMTRASDACREGAWLPLLSSHRDRVQGTGVSAVGVDGAAVRPTGPAVAALKGGFGFAGDIAPTQLTAMDVVYPVSGRPPV